MQDAYNRISSPLFNESKNAIQRFNFCAWSLGIFLFFLVVRKGLTIPITHDESGQILYYAQMSLYDILTYASPWPTNHIFNSLLIKLATFIGGISQLTGRLPNFLLFLVFYWYTVRWAVLFFKHQIVGLLVTIALLVFNPYLFDFFSLARGYGMALSFQLMALYHLYKFLKDGVETDAMLLHIALFFMVLSNFSWLPLWAAIELVLFLFNVWHKKWKSIVYQFVGVLFVIGFSAMPVMVMNSTNQFVYWESTGIVHDTLLPLWQHFMYSLVPTKKHLNFFLIIFIISQIALVYQLTRKPKQMQKLWLFPLLLLLCLLISKIQFWLLHTPYLTGRTALLYYPLFSLCILASLYSIMDWKLLYRISSTVIAVLFSVVMISNYQSKSVKEWNYDLYTFKILDLMKIEHEKSKTDITLDCNWLYHPSLNFYVETDKSLDWLHLIPYHKEPNSIKDYPFYYGHEGEFEQVREKGYQDYWIAGWHGLFYYPK